MYRVSTMYCSAYHRTLFTPEEAGVGTFEKINKRGEGVVGGTNEVVINSSDLNLITSFKYNKKFYVLSKYNQSYKASLTSGAVTLLPPHGLRNLLLVGGSTISSWFLICWS